MKVGKVKGFFKMGKLSIYIIRNTGIIKEMTVEVREERIDERSF